LRRDLRKLGELLPKGCALLIAGRASSGYKDVVREIKAIRVEELEDLFPVLETLQRRKPRPAKKRAD